MKNHSMKTLILLASLLLATSAPAKADSQKDQGMFWFAYTVGVGTSLCMATEAGEVRKGYAAEFVQATLAETDTDPDLIPFKQYFLKAYQDLKKIWPQCYE
tara:strand:+ start:284 stop:586 length:303 start_codon:yes stop_codon:yes gene_type:complete